MNILKKRYGTILAGQMTKEIEETILGDASQMEKLSEEIDNLKEIIINKDITIKILNDENTSLKDKIVILESLINKNENNNSNNLDIDYNKIKNSELEELKIKDSINIKESEEYKNILKELNSLKNKYKDIQEDYRHIQEIKNNDSLEKDIFNNPEYIELKREKELLEEEINNKDTNKIDELNQTIDELKEKLKNISNEEKNKNNLSINKTKNKNLELEKPVFNILTKYPIKVYTDIGDSKIKKLIAAEIAYKVKYQCKIAEETERSEENITMEEVIDYIIQQEGLSQQDRSYLKKKFERCIYLDKHYKDKLNIFKFSIYNVGYMSKKHWELWLKELDSLIEENTDKKGNIDIKCEYVYKKGNVKGKICGKIDCKNKNHSEINWLFNEITNYNYDSAYGSDEDDENHNEYIKYGSDDEDYNYYKKIYDNLNKEENYMDDEDDNYSIESNKENKICEWNKYSLYRDYCYKLKENNIYCKEHIEEDIDNYFGLKYIKYIIYIEEKLLEDIYISYIPDIITIENIFINEKNKYILYITEINILNNIDISIFNYISTDDYETISDTEFDYMNKLIDEIDSDTESIKSYVSVNSFYNNKYCDIITPDNAIEHYYNRLKIKFYIKDMIKYYHVFDFSKLITIPKELDEIDIYIEEINLLYNINIDIFNYEIISNITICDEEYCYEKAEDNEDLCRFHIDEQNYDDYDENNVKIVKIEYNRYKIKDNYLSGPNYYKGMIKFKYKGILYNK